MKFTFTWIRNYAWLANVTALEEQISAWYLDQFCVLDQPIDRKDSHYIYFFSHKHGNDI